jgi:hypothetical protein
MSHKHVVQLKRTNRKDGADQQTNIKGRLPPDNIGRQAPE